MAFHLEREALIASGLDDEIIVEAYIHRLRSLASPCFTPGSHSAPIISRARCLFSGLWKDRPARYQREGPFRLHQVIDAQTQEGPTAVGNCLGLTCLYNSLLKIIDISAKAVYLENAFHIGPHVLTLLETDHFRIDIENILPEGFDYPGHKDNPSRTLWGDRELVADIYHSAGNENFERGRFSEALQNYDRALELNPGYEKAGLNRTILLDRMKG
jgi:tetratricopeptide (TPR) repeat protein